MLLVEAIIAFTILMAVLTLGVVLWTFVSAVVLLPFKITFFLAKGLLGLLFILPALLLAGVIFSAALPILLLVAVVPVLIVGGIAFSIITI